MKILIIIGSVALPVVMLYLKHKSKKAQLLFNVISVISAVIFGNIAAISIYQIIIDDLVFMTTIHNVFLNPLFLITGAYLGLYIVYRLLVLAMQES